MAIINGKALVKDGKAVDKVFSNGRQVYGRNLLDGTRDFSGTWEFQSSVVNDGFYNNLIVKSQSNSNTSILKRYIVTKDVDYTFSAWVSASSGQLPSLVVGKNRISQGGDKLPNTAFDWVKVMYTLNNVKSGDELTGRIDKTSNVSGKVSVAGHKWEFGSTATPWTPAPEDYI